jgi:hypothetical protein
MNFRELYDLESYLFETVRQRFTEHGSLSAFDFFCIVIWKANRAKSTVAHRLISKGGASLEDRVQMLTKAVALQPTAKRRLRCLIVDWGFRLPMASAILTVLYPDEFTVYDIRVCDQLGDFHRLGTMVNFERQWSGYEEFKQRVGESAPKDLTLRDKDRYLWGKSFHDQLTRQIETGFHSRSPT